MADRRYEIEFVTTQSGTGAADTIAQLDAARRSAEEASDALRRIGDGPTAVPQFTSDIDAAAAAVRSLGGESTATVSGLRGLDDPIAEMRRQFRGMAQDIGHLQEEVRNFPESSGEMEVSIGKLLSRFGQLQLVLAAGIGGFRLIQWMKDVSAAMTDTVSPVDALTSKMGELRAETEKAANVKFDAVVDEINALDARLDGILDDAERAKRLSDEVADSKQKSIVSGIRLQEQKDLASAGSDEERAAIRQRAEIAVQAVTAERAIEKSTSERALIAEQMKQTASAIDAVQLQRLRVEREIQEASSEYLAIVSRLKQYGLAAEKMVQDTSAIEQARTAAVAKGASSGGTSSDIQAASDLGRLRPAFDEFYAAQKAGEAAIGRIDKETADLKGKAAILADRLGIAENRLVDVQNTSGAKQIELVGESRAKLDDIYRAIQAAQQRVETARETLKAAQISGNATAQGQAFEYLQQAEQDLASLRRIAERLRADLPALGEAGRIAAEAVGENLKAGAAVIATAGVEMATAAKKVEADFTQATGSVTRATEGAQASSAEAISKLGAALERNLGGLTNSIERLAQNQGQLSRRIEEVASEVQRVDSKTETVAAQLRNQ